MPLALEQLESQQHVNNETVCILLFAVSWWCKSVGMCKRESVCVRCVKHPQFPLLLIKRITLSSEISLGWICYRTAIYTISGHRSRDSHPYIPLAPEQCIIASSHVDSPRFSSVKREDKHCINAQVSFNINCLFWVLPMDITLLSQYLIIKATRSSTNLPTAGLHNYQ